MIAIAATAATAAIGAAISSLPRVIDWAAEKKKAKDAESLSRFVPFTTPTFGDGLFYEPDAGIRLELLDRARQAPAQSAVYYVLSLIVGTPYVWAGESLTGADCSGGFALASKMFSATTGQRLSTTRTTTSDMAKQGSRVASPSFGDVVLYGERRVTHAEFYLGSNYVVGWNGGGSERRSDNLDPAARCRIKPVDWWTILDVRRLPR